MPKKFVRKYQLPIRLDMFWKSVRIPEIFISQMKYAKLYLQIVANMHSQRIKTLERKKFLFQSHVTWLILMEFF